MKATAKNSPPANATATGALLTVRELARILRLNEQTVYRLARTGAIPSIHVGPKAIRFDLDEVRNATSRQPSAKTREAGGLQFVTLDEVRRSGVWPTPPADLTPARFSVKFSTRDITALAYDRDGEDS
jgi:excisionase family DNA binding protein